MSTNTRKLAGSTREKRPCVKATTTSMCEEQDVESVEESQYSSKDSPEDQETPTPVKEQPSQENEEDNSSNNVTASCYYDHSR